MGERMIGDLVEVTTGYGIQPQLVHELPSGTLTFLFTDIVGSTHTWEQHPEQMAVALRRHDALIESAVDGHAGTVVRPRGEGDSRFAVFTRASDALRAAIAIQRLLLAEPWTIPPLQVRVALHTGEAELREGDYYGSVVNRCARLRSAAFGGQILVSQSTYYLVRDALPAGVSLRDLGEHKFKDLERLEHIYQPVVSDLPADFPPLKTPDQIRSNLPVSLTTFVGRGREIEELEHLLSQSRLLTIAGPGGAGKTRLAIQVAQNVQGSFPDGIWFIDLAPLTSASLLSQHVLSVLGMREEAGYTPDQTLIDALNDKASLLVFDNCEHLLPDVAHLAENILRSTPRVRILATSREKLGAMGENVWRIPPLSSPGLMEATSFEDLLQYEAVILFRDRAVEAWSNFTITRENADAVRQICARLDGIPLAIELAAARVRVLSVEEIVARLDDRFRLLVGNRTALPRQQTLRALLDWSYDLLTEKERILLRRLSVFSGGWTLEAAERVCAGGAIEVWDVLDLLTDLIDKSFVIGDTRSGHERYRFLETTLQFSQGRLLESGEVGEFEQKHAAYFLNKTVSSYGEEWGEGQAARLMWLDEEYDNLRTALGWLSRVSGNEEMLLQLAGSLWRYWEIRGCFSEGRAWLEIALAKSSDTPGYWLANGLSGAGHLARQQGDYEKAQALHEQSLNLFRELGSKLNIARQLNALGEIAHFQGDYVLAVALHEDSLSLRQESGDKEGIAVSLRQLGVIARDRSRYQHAKVLLEESLKLAREMGDKLLIALSLNELGLVVQSLCGYEQAFSLFEEAISIQRQLNDRLGIPNSIHNMANVAKDQGDLKRAEALCQEALARKKELGDKRGIAHVTASLAEVAFWQGRYPLAAELAGQSLIQSQELGLKRGILASMEILGFTAHYQGDYRRSAQLAHETLVLATEMEAQRGIGFAKILSALVEYAKGNLVVARDGFQEALTIFKNVNDCKNIASIYVNLARTAYRQGDNAAARQYLDESLALSLELDVRWTVGFVYEIMGLLERSEGNYEHALELFQDSLRLSVEQENQQGIANCLGGLAGLAVVSDQTARAARLFAAAARLRREMGAKMSSNDQVEYEQYLTLVHERMDHAAFETEWSEGFMMTTEQVIEDLEAWSGDFSVESLQETSHVPVIQHHLRSIILPPSR